MGDPDLSQWLSFITVTRDGWHTSDIKPKVPQVRPAWIGGRTTHTLRRDLAVDLGYAGLLLV